MGNDMTDWITAIFFVTMIKADGGFAQLKVEADFHTKGECQEFLAKQKGFAQSALYSGEFEEVTVKESRCE